MKQLVFDMLSGKPRLEEVPIPGLTGGRLLVRSTRSLVSVGTERGILADAQSSLVAKARSHPDRVRQVLDKIRVDGVAQTMRAVKGKLAEPKALGYCQVGLVEKLGPSAKGFRVDDRVITNGPHAQWVAALPNLAAKVPDEVSDDQAAFVVLGSIALQGIRLAAPTFGETVAVIGLGVIGQLAVQFLAASGCRVLAFDPQPKRVDLVRQCGALGFNAAETDACEAAMAATGGIGVDAVLITASAQGDKIIGDAARMCRQRGRVVLVGVVGLNLDRNLFYKKELSFQISCSYGPGRYDEAYEEGLDYPAGYVRWTAQRNFAAVLEAFRTGRLNVAPLIERCVPFAEAEQAYAELLQAGDALGVLFEYAQAHQEKRFDAGAPAARGAAVQRGDAVGIIGAGSFARSTLLPALKKVGAGVSLIADLDGSAAAFAAKIFKGARASSNYRDILDDPSIGTVFVLTRHDQHAVLVLEALSAQKNVFVEKPLALNEDELEAVAQAAASSRGLLLVGFNRRFSPHTLKCADLLATRSEPLAMAMTVNAGAIPPSSWVQDSAIGGGRVIGEACHFMDLMACLAGAPILSVSASQQGGNAAFPEDKISIVLGFADGSVGTVNYFANGPKEYPKETLDVFCSGRVLRIEDFRRTAGWGWKTFSGFKTPGQDKGHGGECRAFLEAATQGGLSPIGLQVLLNSTRASFAAVTAARERRTIVLEGT